MVSLSTIRKCRPLGLVVLKRIFFLCCLLFYLTEANAYFEEGAETGRGSEEILVFSSSSGIFLSLSVIVTLV